MHACLCVEEIVPKSFRASTITGLECFALSFKCKRSRVDATMKVCGIGVEGCWLPAVCVQKWIKYEGDMLKPQYAPKLLEELYSSQPNFILCC